MSRNPVPTASDVGRLHHRRQGWLSRLLLAVILVVLVLSVVGMHQLSVGHDVATGQSTPEAQAQAAPHLHSGSEAMPVVETLNLGQIASAGSGGATGDGCLDCGNHQMAFGSCLLALTLLVLTWTLLPPRPRLLPPSLLPKRAFAAVGLAPGRLIPPLSLTELSLRRT